MVGPTHYPRFNWDGIVGFLRHSSQGVTHISPFVLFALCFVREVGRRGDIACTKVKNSVVAEARKPRKIIKMAASLSPCASDSGDSPWSTDLSASGRGGKAEGSIEEAVASKRGKGRVNFGTITAWEFPPTIGDNPSVSAGVPISLGHSPSSTAVVDIDAYEKSRKPRRTTRQLKIDCREREEM
jgi:hypothetical protein